MPPTPCIWRNLPAGVPLSISQRKRSLDATQHYCRRRVVDSLAHEFITRRYDGLSLWRLTACGFRKVCSLARILFAACFTGATCCRVRTMPILSASHICPSKFLSLSLSPPILPSLWITSHTHGLFSGAPTQFARLRNVGETASVEER